MRKQIMKMEYENEKDKKTPGSPGPRSLGKEADLRE